MQTKPSNSTPKFVRRYSSTSSQPNSPFLIQSPKHNSISGGSAEGSALSNGSALATQQHSPAEKGVTSGATPVPHPPLPPNPTTGGGASAAVSGQKTAPSTTVSSSEPDCGGDTKKSPLASSKSNSKHSTASHRPTTHNSPQLSISQQQRTYKPPTSPQPPKPSHSKRFHSVHPTLKSKSTSNIRNRRPSADSSKRRTSLSQRIQQFRQEQHPNLHAQLRADSLQEIYTSSPQEKTSKNASLYSRIKKRKTVTDFSSYARQRKVAKAKRSATRKHSSSQASRSKSNKSRGSVSTQRSHWTPPAAVKRNSYFNREASDSSLMHGLVSSNSGPGSDHLSVHSSEYASPSATHSIISPLSPLSPGRSPMHGATRRNRKRSPARSANSKSLHAQNSPSQLSPLRIQPNYSPPEWNGMIPETTLMEINEKIVLFERELNRLYQKKKRLLSPHSRKRIGDAAASESTESSIPLEQRLKRLYHTLPSASRKIYRQTVSAKVPLQSTRSHKSRKQPPRVTVHDHELECIIWSQTILRCLMAKLELNRMQKLRELETIDVEVRNGTQSHAMVKEEEEQLSLEDSHVQEADTAPVASDEEQIQIGEEKPSSVESLSTANDRMQKPQKEELSTEESDSTVSIAPPPVDRDEKARIIQRVFRRFRVNQFVLRSQAARRIQRRWKRYCFHRDMEGKEQIIYYYRAE